MNSADTFLGRRVRQLRWVCGVSQAQLAKHLSVDVAQINAYESGADRMAAVHLSQIAALLGIPATSFFAGLPSGPGARQDLRHQRSAQPVREPQDAEAPWPADKSEH